MNFEGDLSGLKGSVQLENMDSLHEFQKDMHEQGFDTVTYQTLTSGGVNVEVHCFKGDFKVIGTYYPRQK